MQEMELELKEKDGIAKLIINGTEIPYLTRYKVSNAVDDTGIVMIELRIPLKEITVQA